ncbi:MAG: fructokinase, partial [Burkholderiales bacterium]|nr:fructokinase [Burkholderiales bacterium]
MSDPAPLPALPPGRAVAVLGEALVDAWPDGSQVPGGAPFNVARWLAAFGVPTLLITRIGRGDAGAASLQAELRRFGLQGPGVQVDAQHPTGRVQVLPGPGGHRFEIAPDSAWDHLDAAPARPLLLSALPRIVCFGSLALRHPVARAAIAELAGATPALRLVDVNLRTVPGLRALAEQALGLADWIKVNEDELQQLLG